MDDFFWSVCYTLQPDGIFEYEELMCVAHVVGQGTYVRNKNSVIFYYDSIDYFNHPIQIEKLGEANRNLHFTLNVRDYDTKEHIDTIHVRYTSNPHRNSELFTDMPFKDDIEDLPITILVSATGYASFYFDLTKFGLYRINLFLKKSKRDAYEWKRGNETFEIVKESDDLLVLMNAESMLKIELHKDNIQGKKQ